MKHYFVQHGHQRILRVVFNLGNKLDTVHNQDFKQLFADISLVPADFALDILNEQFRVKRFSVIHGIEFL